MTLTKGTGGVTQLPEAVQVMALEPDELTPSRAGPMRR